MKKTALTVAAIFLYCMHQDIWFWRSARPLVFGVIPVGLFYHGCFSVAASLLMWMMVKYAWPSELENEIEQREAEEVETT